MSLRIAQRRDCVYTIPMTSDWTLKIKILGLIQGLFTLRQFVLQEVEAAKRRKALPPKLYEDDEHSIRGVQIPRSAWLVLLKLRAAGGSL